MKLRPPKGWGRCAGISIGGCVSGRAIEGIDTVAHAHERGAHSGWICFKEAWRVGRVVLRREGGWDGCVSSASRALVHEHCHLLVPPGHAHDRVWQAMMVAQGQPRPSSAFLPNLPLREAEARQREVTALIDRDGCPRRNSLSISDATRRHREVERIINTNRRIT